MVIEHRNGEGVLLRYHPDRLGRHHIERKCQPSDRLRRGVVKAQREARILWILVEHLEVSGIGQERISQALQSIDAALNLAREELGLAQVLGLDWEREA